MAPMLVVFEGLDGVGKSTQIQLLAEYLRDKDGREVVVVQEPGGTPLGEAVRSLLLDPKSGHLEAATELFLFMAARSHLVSKRIRPTLARGATVLCDRFLWSSVVYQGIIGGLGVERVLEQGKLAIGNLKPTTTILLDISVDGSLHRTSKRQTSDRFEEKVQEEGRRYQEKLREGYLELAKRFPDEIQLVDGSGTVEAVHKRVLEVLEGLIK